MHRRNVVRGRQGKSILLVVIHLLVVSRGEAAARQVAIQSYMLPFKFNRSQKQLQLMLSLVGSGILVLEVLFGSLRALCLFLA